tara:strand:- start:2603 stop:3442 length:840 start_codon:yes stop_codon:yes gene_type:complete
MATNDGGQDSAGASEADVADATESDGPVGTTASGIGHDMGELSDDDNDTQDSVSFADVPTGQEDEEGTDVDVNFVDPLDVSHNPHLEVDYTAYEDTDLKDMHSQSHAVQMDKDFKTLVATVDKKNKHNPKNKSLVQDFKDKWGKTINQMSKTNTQVEQDKARSKGLLSNLTSAAPTNALEAMVSAIAPMGIGIIGKAMSATLTSWGLSYSPVAIETDLDQLEQELGLKETDAQSNVADPTVERLKAECEGREGYRWDDAMASCVIDTTKKQTIDVVNPY